MTFPRFIESKDPNDIKPYTIRVRLPDGDAPDTVTVTVVDANDAPIVSTDLIVGSVTVGQISGQLYGATFTPTGGVAGEYLLRSRWLTTLGDQYDATMRLIVEQR